MVTMAMATKTGGSTTTGAATTATAFVLDVVAIVVAVSVCWVLSFLWYVIVTRWTRIQTHPPIRHLNRNHMHNVGIHGRPE